MHTLDYCKELQVVYDTRETLGRSGKKHQHLTALSTLNNLHLIRQLMQELTPARTLEVGLAFGGSAVTFAASHRDLGRLPEQQHIAIDPCQSTYWDDSGRVLLERTALEGYVKVMESQSSQALPEIVSRHDRFGMIYVDGSHEFDDVLLDFLFCHKVLEVNGVILFDDSQDTHVRKVLKIIDSHYSGVYARVSQVGKFEIGIPRLRRRLIEGLRKCQLTVYRKLRDR